MSEEPVLSSTLKDVKRRPDGSFSIRPGLGDIILDSILLAASFEGTSILLVWIVAALSGVPVGVGEIVLLAIYAVFVLVLVAVPFVPVALLRAKRRYGQGSAIARFYGFVVALLFWPLIWALTPASERTIATFQAVLRAFGEPTAMPPKLLGPVL